MSDKYPGIFPNMQIPSLEPNKYQLEQIARKFGMFLHFGINTFNNLEWSDGTLPIDSYRPTGIHADEWVRTAYEAGMNYVIAITKHHDGFCMFDTDTTEYSVKYSPVKTDVIAEVAKACKKYGVKLALYYSLWDRHEPCYNDDEMYYSYMEKHLTELLGGKYGEVVELWLDGSWDKPCTHWHFDRMYDLVKRLQPQCQFGINQTVGVFDDVAGMSVERYMPKNYQDRDPLRMFPSDFRLWDPHTCRDDDPKIYTFGGKEYYMPFEQTICSRENGCWFYNDKYAEGKPTDADTVVSDYKRLMKTDNLMVINLPPDTDGRLVPGDVENLMKIADKLGIRRTANK